MATPLGPDALIARRLEGEERLSSLFDYVLDADLTDPDADLSTLPGQSADVTLVDGDGGETVLNALIWAVRREGDACRLTLRPALAKLTLTSDNRIFQDKTALDIVAAVLGGAGVSDHRAEVAATPAVRPYCVQFGESDFAFVSRLLEEEGIGYTFAHSAGAHTLVLFDDASACPALAGAALPYLPLPPGAAFSADRRVARVATSAGLAPGKVVARDYVFETPTLSLEATVGEAARGLYVYPGRHADSAAGQAVARRLLEAGEAAASAIDGDTPWRPLGAGMRATLSGTPGGAADGKLLIRAVRRRAGDNAYSASFEAQPADAPWRPLPLTPRPRMAGPQTAVVVGSAGEEIWTDAHGRVKVQFHWDREGARDENASCWLRVAQIWAGAGWGGFVLPRIGQEVVVSFLDGDPDRPLVTGVVYNGANPPPYALPGMQTRTTLKSNSSAGGAGFNELRFEDKADAEEVYLHAARDMAVDVVNDRKTDVGHDETVTVKNARTVTISEGAESLTVTRGARSVKVTAGDETHEVGGKRTLKVTGDETRTYEAKLTETVTGDCLLTVKGGLTIKVSGNVTIQADGGLNLKSGGAFSISAGGAFSLSAGSSASISAGSSVEVKAGATLSLKGSATGEVDGGGMLTLKGGLVKVN